ncbi:flagellar basal-body MS-ring/collar protein FliF [Natranaerovirga hydrolytica]|nr:flagellar basal-body MS-ring/collar protein FliF [Natranaerovirga hydrolytica]
MNETLNNFSQQITNFFEKYDKKQKIKIFGIAAAVIASLVLLVFIINQPNFDVLVNDVTPQQAAEIRDILEENNIRHRISSDGSTIEVETKQTADANMALGQRGIPTSGFTYQDAFATGFSTTEAERQKMYELAFRGELAESIKTIEGIDDAIVNLVMPNQDRTIFDENKEASASVLLTTQESLTQAQVQGIVNFLIAGVPNLAEKNVRVVDQRGNVLYYGEESEFQNSLGSQYDYLKQRTLSMERNLMSALLRLGIIDDAEVMVNLSMDFDRVSSTSEEYSTPEGQDTGIPRSTYSYESMGTQTDIAGGAPGVDANAIPEYAMPDGGGSESSTNINQIEYEVNRTITNIEREIGRIQTDQSSVAVVVNEYDIIREEDLINRGELEDRTFQEYQEEEMDNLRTPLGEDVINQIQTLVASATGIENVQVIGYRVPIFYDAVIEETPWTDYIPLGLTVLIIGLLAFAVYKGMGTEEVIETEPELSVEDMLATTKEHQEMDKIEFDDKSEARKQIENFVDDNPDAVAQLLRNWLNEDWEG